MAQAVRTLENLSAELTNIEQSLADVNKIVPKKEAGVLRAALHNLKNAHFMLEGTKWMLEHPKPE